ncbi:zinc-finger domain-containing protein [Gorillibacterium sp. sgz5001074]|uniref:zinc-finger domain-containing protein n=1 Tax=Gorillibacterium sp. sgz5001074 TaxID=3446695 RepID=UPI003F665EAD
MCRLDILRKLDDILINTCGKCEKRNELNKEYGSTFSKIDGYCNKECPVGNQLQAIGKLLSVKQRRVSA